MEVNFQILFSVIYVYFFVLLMFISQFVTCEKRYDNYRLLKCDENTTKAIKMSGRSDEIKFIGSPAPRSRTVILISNNEYKKLLNNLTNCEVLNDNFQSVLDNEKKELALERSKMRYPSDILKIYPRYNEMISFITNLSSQNPKIASLHSIGKSFEGRKMKLIKICGSRKKRLQNNDVGIQQKIGKKGCSKKKPIIFIDAGIHAREWIAPITSLYIANELINKYNREPLVKRLVDTFEWQILPSANPDGYEYTHYYDRIWRKTRSKRSYDHCVGVDANRNFNFHWNEVGTSNDSCDDNYAGPKAFSEVETKNIRNYILKQKQRMKAYLSFHSFGQFWMCPWAYTSNLPANYNDLISKAKLATNALKSKYGTVYSVGSSTQILYPLAGSSGDWALGVASVPFSYTVELRPDESSSNSSFILPLNQIEPTAEEIWDGVKAFAASLI